MNTSNMILIFFGSALILAAVSISGRKPDVLMVSS